MEIKVTISTEQIEASVQEIVDSCVDTFVEKQTGWSFRQEVTKKLIEASDARLDEAIRKVLDEKDIVENEVREAMKRRISRQLTKLMKENES